MIEVSKFTKLAGKSPCKVNNLFAYSKTASLCVWKNMAYKNVYIQFNFNLFTTKIIELKQVYYLHLCIKYELFSFLHSYLTLQVSGRSEQTGVHL